ncbi:hypothetical protein ABKN59_004479 [Abortiporus biennis]
MADDSSFLDPDSHIPQNTQRSHHFERGTSDPRWSLRSCTIRQLLDAKQQHSKAPFCIDGREISKVTVVAHDPNPILREEDTNTGSMRYWFSLDDGTSKGPIKGTYNTTISFQKSPLDYYRVAGDIYKSNHKITMRIDHILPVTNPHEIYFHYLEVMNVTLSYTARGPPPGTSELVHIPAVVRPSQPMTPKAKRSPPPSRPNPKDFEPGTPTPRKAGGSSREILDPPTTVGPEYSITAALMAKRERDAEKLPAKMEETQPGGASGPSVSQPHPNAIGATSSHVSQGTDTRDMSKDEEDDDGESISSTSSVHEGPEDSEDDSQGYETADSGPEDSPDNLGTNGGGKGKGRDPFSHLSSFERDIILRIAQLNEEGVEPDHLDGKGRIFVSRIVRGLRNVDNYLPGQIAEAFDNLCEQAFLDSDDDRLYYKLAGSTVKYYLPSQ